MHFSPARLYRMAKSKAYLFRGVEIRWACDPALIKDETPAEDVLKFPGGLLDFLRGEIGKAATVTGREFSGRTDNKRDGTGGAVEWAVAWTPSLRSLRPVLLQHHPDAAGRHARTGPAQRPGQGAARPWRTGE